MFVGHLGAGLLVKRIEPRLNLGVLFAAALFADLLLWVLVLLGAESVGAPESTGAARFFTFVFPYSHGLVPTVLWTALAALAGWFLVAPEAPRRTRVAWALGLAVFSHFALDLIVHVPDLPILGEQSPKLGLSLWRNMPVALALELLLAAGALALYLRSVHLSRGRWLLVCATVAVAAILTASGPYIPGAPPPAKLLAMSSLATLIVVVVLGFVVEGRVRVLTDGQDVSATRR
jgi:hypothetical protein